MKIWFLSKRHSSQSSVCSVTSCWFGNLGTLARTLRICFRVFRGHIAYVPRAMSRRPVGAFFGENLGVRFLSG